MRSVSVVAVAIRCAGNIQAEQDTSQDPLAQNQFTSAFHKKSWVVAAPAVRDYMVQHTCREKV
jgi:hypothetical protein